MSLFRTAEMAMPTWAGTTSSAKVAVTQSELKSKDAGASQALAVWCHSLGLVAAAALEKLCPGCSGVTGEEENHLHSRQEKQGLHAELRTTKSCAVQRRETLGGLSWEWWVETPTGRSLEISASLAVLSRLHEPAIVLLYTTLPKELKRQHGHYTGFVMIAVS